MTKSFDDLRFSEFYGELPNYVGNKYVSVATDKFYESYDPGTGKVIAKVPETPSEEIERAIEVAYNAFEKWSR
ncbi:MAG: aldehyde dehydrogenase family protein, partial [Sulfolobales archaeon]